MTVDLIKQLDDLKGQWMIGGSAIHKSLPSWRLAAQDDDFPDLALIALAGQAMQFALQPSPGVDLQMVAGLPKLRLPPPPLPSRRLFTQLIRVSKLSEPQLNSVVWFHAARGYSVHPLDYMPKKFAQLPDLYSPWEAWQRAEQKSEEIDPATILNAGNWNEWPPADRRTALQTLRRQDPVAARELIVDKVPSLAADERLRILELLSEGLCQEDQALLERFVEDRSAKVRKCVQFYLARIGAARDAQADIDELASFYSVSKALLKRGVKVVANPLKTDAQKKCRHELTTALSLQSFVQGLKLNSESELIEGWEHVDVHASDDLLRMVAATGSDQAVAKLATRLFSLDGISTESFQLLFVRLGKESLRDLLPRVLEKDDVSFSATLLCCQRMLGELQWELLKPLRAIQDMKKLCMEDSSSNHVQQETLRQGLFALGLLADRAAAIELVNSFTETNLFASDPLLGMLRLNICLPLGESL
ncbi:DUF5691 domain-containing protein [Pirellulaceae bacterium SH449]